MTNRRFSIFNLAALILALTSVGCRGFKMNQVQFLPGSDLALALPAVTQEPAVYAATDLTSSDCEMVPYALRAGALVNNKANRERVWAQGLRERNLGQPDLLTWQVRRELTGTSGVSAYGVSQTQRVFTDFFTLGYYRITPARIGVLVDESGMVVRISSDGARAAGILEGDSVLTMNGHVVKYSDDNYPAPLMRERLRLQPGDTVKMIWIRPGTGRMEGEWAAEPNGEFVPGVQPLFRAGMKPARSAGPSVQFGT